MKNCDEIVQDLLERREEYMKIKREKTKKLVVACTSVLCALAVVVLAGITLWGKEKPAQKNIAKNTENIISDNVAEKDNQKLGDDKAENDDADNDVKTDDKTDDKVEKEEYAVYTQGIMLPKDIDENVSYDMIGCLYYKGSVYTEDTSYYGKEVEKMKKLFGEKIGDAKGTLNEWSTQEEWATEFASTYSGSVYEAKGYGEDFLLFIYSNTGEEEWVTVMENYDRIGLNTGSDLFEKRFHLDGNVKEVMYQTHEDWNKDWEDEEERESRIKKLDGVTDKEWDKFIEELYRSPFREIDYQKEGDFYDKEPQGHLYLHMKDGMDIEMRLFDGGYVGCQSLGWYYVEMPGEIFDKVMGACQK